MIYRTAVPADIPALRTLGLASYGTLRNHLTADNWKKMESVLLSEDTYTTLVNACFAFICEEETQLLGMAFLVPSGNPTKIYSDDTSYIRMVGVHPDAGGKGIAQSLTRLCMEKAKELGEKTIMLHSAEVMYTARHVYEKLGFKKMHLLDEHYGLEYWLYRYNMNES
jgi:ribosomal protein S18 acetylase RimI-like enzyme